ncbi:MAG: hypothetical protein COA30_01790 [Sulfurimonas sp.]|nr:MAG: hypothetical protein COA30_04915 [Sulfurimonas sp.]PHQ57883.1 MAG: hypothetical protein COA30_01790 [Sulfurimonas sp.]
MNRSTFALFVALLIHLLFVLLFWILGTLTPTPSKPKQEENKIKISLKELPKKHKESGLNKNKPKPQTKAPPMPKGKQLKKIVKPPVKFEPKQAKKTPKLNKPKTKTLPKTLPKPKVEPLLPPLKPFIPLIEKKKDLNKTKKPKNDDPLAWMLEDKSDKEEKSPTEITAKGAQVGGNTREMKKLYGEKWKELSPGQQKYMLDNQEIMRRITQQVLSRVARVNLPHDLNVNRSNVIEFYLHPNGDMTDFKFLSKSGYYVLDDTTKETIEYAYSRYPRPKEKTLIRYNVYYHLARY